MYYVLQILSIDINNGGEAQQVSWQEEHDMKAMFPTEGRDVVLSYFMADMLRDLVWRCTKSSLCEE